MVLVLKSTVPVYLYLILTLDETLIKKWKFFGKIEKGYETKSKSYYHHLCNVNSKMSCPPNEKNSINIYNNILIFQVLLLNQKSFSIEIKATDNSDCKRRFYFSTSYKSIETHEFHIQIPMTSLIPNVWTNIYFDIGNLLSQSFRNQIIKYIDYISISGCCKIRKIFAIKNINDPIHKSILLSKNVLIRNMKVDNVNNGLESYNIGVPNTTSTNINFVALGENLNAENNHNNQYNVKPNKISNKPTQNLNKSTNKKENLKDIHNNEQKMNNVVITNNKLADTLKQKTNENLNYAKRLPEFNIINKQIQYNAKKNQNNISKENKNKNSFNNSKNQEKKNENNKKEDLIKNQNDINSNEPIENKFNKFGIYENFNLVKQQTLNDSIEEIYDFNDNPLAESILIKAPEINTVTNIKNEDIIHIDKQNYNGSINKTQKLLNEIVNNNQKEDNYKLNNPFFNDIEIDDLRDKFDVENNRPYSPPIGKMIPVSDVNQKEVNINNLINDRDLNPLLSSVASVSSKFNNRAIKNYENLIYDEKEGKYFDPILKIYYDVKNKEK